MDVHGVEMDNVKVPVAELAEEKARKLAMQQPLMIDEEKAKAISAGFNNATGYKGEPDGK